MSVDVKIIADSVNPNGQRITTMSLRYWRAIHAEVLTHRTFSRSASSSRAIPVAKMLSQVWNDPAGPIHWGQNQPGMQSRSQLEGAKLWAAKSLWKWAGRTMVAAAWIGLKLGGHKQWVNRLLEPWQYISVVVTATEWDNFYALRCHPDAQPEIQQLAEAMRFAHNLSVPKKLEWGQWHIPFVDWYVHAASSDLLTLAIRTSVARCARTSYNNHMGRISTESEDVKLHNQLVHANPPHMSPTEHQAVASAVGGANFRGWTSYRSFLEEGALP